MLRFKKLLLSVFASLDEAILLVNTATHMIEECNPATEQIFGYSRAELVGSDTRDLHVNVPMFEWFFQESSTSFKERGFYSTEFLMKRKNGEVFPTEHYVAPLNQKGKEDVVVSVVRDITKRKKSQEALEDTTQLLGNIINASHQLIAYLDPHFNIVEINNAFAKALGKSISSLRKKNFFELHPNLDLLALFTRVASGNRPHFSLADLFFAGQPQSYWDWSLIPTRTQSGRLTGLLLTLSNVTERVKMEDALTESEDRYHSLFEKSSAAMLLIDPTSGQLVDANQAACQFYGYSRERMLEMKLSDINPMSDDRLSSEMFNALRMEKRHFLFQHRLANGEIRDVEVYSGPVQAKRRTMLYSIIHDITERRRIEQERDQLFDATRIAREQLQALSHRLINVQEAERRVIARELHDQVGQALTAVKLDLQSLGLTTQNEAAQLHVTESLEVIEQAIQQVRTLSFNLRPSILDDLGLVSALRWYLNQQERRGEFNVHFSAHPIEPRPSPEIETICFRVAQEALTNIARHAGRCTVSVTLESTPDELYLNIADDGVGFEMGLEPLKGEGSLGLLGMVERVQLGGGKLTIRSKPGMGTTIKVCLPRILPVEHHRL